MSFFKIIFFLEVSNSQKLFRTIRQLTILSLLPPMLILPYPFRPPHLPNTRKTSRKINKPYRNCRRRSRALPAPSHPPVGRTQRWSGRNVPPANGNGPPTTSPRTRMTKRWRWKRSQRKGTAIHRN